MIQLSTGQLWAIILACLAAGFLAGWRAGVWWVPLVLGKIHTLATRGNLRDYRRRRR